MKITLVFAVLCGLCTFAVAIRDPDFNAANDIAQVLASEPAAASSRFAEVHTAADVITFRDDSKSEGSSSSSLSDSGEDSEFDGQIAQVQEDIKRVKASIKETQECAHRLTEQQAQLRSLVEQRDNIQKEKEKTILQAKLDKQMRDLSEINRMSRALRNKFTELKRTQQMIKQKLTGTKSSLNQLDANPDLTTDDINESTKDIVSEVDAMHKAQSTILDSAHSSSHKTLKTEITNANNINMQGRASSHSGSDI